jgi:tRNA pseudouridine55 synthase
VSVGKFHEKDAISLANLPEVVYKPALLNAWVSIELALDDIPAIDMSPNEASLLRHGQSLQVDKPDGNYMALTQGHILALVEIKSKTLRSTRVFNLK